MSSVSGLLPPFRRIIFQCVRYVVQFYCVAVDILMVSGIHLSKCLRLTERKRKKAEKGKLERAMLCFHWRGNGVFTRQVTKAH